MNWVLRYHGWLCRCPDERMNKEQINPQEPQMPLQSRVGGKCLTTTPYSSTRLYFSVTDYGPPGLKILSIDTVHKVGKGCPKYNKSFRQIKRRNSNAVFYYDSRELEFGWRCKLKE